MNPVILLFLSSLFIKSLSSRVEPAKINAHITVMGFVYCDICSNNSFSRHSYFLPGAGVRIDCKFKASSPKTKEQVSFSVNRTTNSLMWSSSKSCNVPGYKSTSDQIAIKARHANLCIYSLSALTFRPSKTDLTLCGN
ncbi:uncharacterized protein LOC110612996 isoform X2 [Manihot esculenta]|uniref:Pollen Ole e 1 allergen and extensin family protein n=1 Tax=Manihot esculenta TaxID=3983 RepID=A0A2C9W278_MANES|nr:uncharacterized protein LOC110612996 isoform X2 [Manihot esculenta]OAY52493.1 hypothetical protein MANES_04G087900v8 [Manihot esculenta]